MVILPTGDRVLVKRDLLPEMRGSLYIPSQWYVPSKDKEKLAMGVTHLRKRAEPQTGRVLAYGPRTREVERDDHILFGKYAGTQYPLLDAAGCLLEMLLVMHEKDVWAVLED